MATGMKMGSGTGPWGRMRFAARALVTYKISSDCGREETPYRAFAQQLECQSRGHSHGSHAVPRCAFGGCWWISVGHVGIVSRGN